MKTKFKLRLMDLIRPENWRYPDVQKFLEVYRWMAETADQRQYQGVSSYDGSSGRWGDPGAQQFLCRGAHGCTGHIDVWPFTGDWITDMKTRFEWVLLSQECAPRARQWKLDHGIDLDAVKWFRASWHEDWRISEHLPWTHGTADHCLVNFLSINEDGADGGPLTWQLNSHHPDAVAIQRIELHCERDHRRGKPWPFVWVFRLLFGYPHDSSIWNHVLAVQEPGEALLDLFARAWFQLRCLQGLEQGEPLAPRDGYTLHHYSKEEWHKGGFSLQYPLLDAIRESFGEEYWALTKEASL